MDLSSNSGDGASTLMKIREVECGNIEFFKLSLLILLNIYTHLFVLCQKKKEKASTITLALASHHSDVVCVPRSF